MSYKSAKKVLPDQLIEMIQQYIDGECIYIPRKKQCRKAWGNNTGAKRKIFLRNAQILKDYISGENMEVLSRKYFLSEKSIQRIIYERKKLI